MTRYAKRVDSSHAEIRDGLRALGFEVLDLSPAGQGVPDLAVKLSPGRSLFLEVKRPDIKKAEQAMTKAQEDWWYFNCSQTRIVQTLEEARREVIAARDKE